MRRLAQLRQEKADLDEQLRRNERLTAMMDKRDMLLDAIKSFDEQIEARQAEIAIEMRAAWKSLVATRASDLTGGLRDRERRLRLQKMRHEVMRASADRGVRPDKCPTCFNCSATRCSRRWRRLPLTKRPGSRTSNDSCATSSDDWTPWRTAARASGETGLRMLWSDLDRLKRDR